MVLRHPALYSARRPVRWAGTACPADGTPCNTTLTPRVCQTIPTPSHDTRREALCAPVADSRRQRGDTRANAVMRHDTRVLCNSLISAICSGELYLPRRLTAHPDVA